MGDTPDTYVVRRTWWHSFKLVLLAIAVALPCAWLALERIDDLPSDPPGQLAMAASALLLAWLILALLWRAVGAARRRLRREIAFSVTAEGVWLGPPTGLLIPWAEIGAIDVVERHAREWTSATFLDLPWRRLVSQGSHVYVLGDPPYAGPPLARLEIDGWRMRTDRLTRAVAHQKPSIRASKLNVAADRDSLRPPIRE